MATAAQLEALADASQRADELVHKKINDAQDDVGTRVDLLAEPDLSLAARRSGTAPKTNMLDKALFNMALRLERRKKGSHSLFLFRIASPHPIRPACAKKNTKLLPNVHSCKTDVKS